MALSTISGTTGITDATITSAKLADFAAAVDLNGVELILDADQDTSITADTDDRIDFKIAGVEHISISNSSGDTVIKPMVDAKDIVFQQYDGNKIFEINDGNFVAVSGAAAGPGEIRIYEDTDNGSHYTGFKAGNNTASVAYVLPTADGTDGFQLTTDGSGTLSWSSAGTTLANDGNNRVVTGTGSGLNGEANLTFDGSTLAVTGAATVSGNLTGSGTVQGTTITATTAFVPDASDGAALGTSSLEFSDLFLADAAVISLGDDDDVTITHVADTGILINSTNVIQFNDASQNIGAPSNAILDINATDEIELNATLVDINANVEISGTAVTTGVHTFTAVPVFPNNTIETADIQADAIDGTKIADDAINSEHYTDGSIDTAHIAADQITNAKIADDQIDSEHYVDGSIDTAHIADAQITTAKLSAAVFTGATDIGAAIVDADLFLMDDGAGGTIRKTTAARIKTYAGVSGDVTTIDSLFKADIKIGEDDQTKIDFETADEIHFYAANVEQVYLADNIFGPQSDSDVDLGTTGVRWKDAFIDTITTTGAITAAGAGQFATMGIGSAKDLGVGLHIKTADAGGGTPGAGRDNLIIEDSGSTGMTIIGGTNNDIGIAMGDSDDVNIGMINYNNANNIMTFQAGGNANVLGITSSTVVINEDSDDVDFRVESNGNANMLVVNGGGDRVGIGGDPDLGVGIHIRTSDTGGDAEIHADELVLENDNNCGITILAGNDDASIINFGDDGDNNIGMISYTHDGNFLRFKTNTVNEVHIGKGTAGAVATGGELAPDVSAGGLCLQQGSADTNVLAFKSSDVAHGVTDQAETDTWCTFRKMDGPRGGLRIDSFLESNTAENSMQFHAHYSGTNQSTERANGSTGLISLRAYKSDGSTDRTGLATNGNVLTVHNAATCMMIVDADGDILANNSNGTFDEYEDANLVRAVDLSHGRGVIDSKFDKFVKYNSKQLMDLDLIGKDKDGSPNNFVNVTKLQRLHNGAIWQQYEKHNQLLDAVYELAKEAVGEKKANAILEKHEVKRLH